MLTSRSIVARRCGVLVLLVAGCSERPLDLPIADLAVTAGEDDLSVAPDLAVAADGAVADLAATPDAAPNLGPVRSWKWINPTPAGTNLHALTGTAVDDVWLVGDGGAIWHFDGKSAALAYQGDPRDVFFSAVARARDDVWVAGQSGKGNLLHWDGQSWSSSFSIGARNIRALFGAPGGSLFAITDDPSYQVWAWVQGAWQAASFYYGADKPALRDGWASGGDGWAVGDQGMITSAHNYWQPETAVDAGTDGPFTTDKSYMGVWGSDPNDVWATFVDGRHQQGFSHWDGSSWQVTKTVISNCGVLPQSSQGHVLWGTSANNIVASRPGCRLLRWNGADWIAPKFSTTWNDDDNASYVALWGDPGGSLYGVGNAFGFARLDPSPDHLWGSVLPVAMRRALWRVGPLSSTRAWAADGYRTLFQWSGQSWVSSPVTTPLDSVDGIAPLADDDAWLIGTISTGSGGIVSSGVFKHWDGKAWSPSTTFVDTQYLWSLSMIASDDGWAVGQGAPWDYVNGVLWALHWNGASWSHIPTPDYTSIVAGANVFQLRSNRAWITALYEGSGFLGVVLRWDGSGFQEVYKQTPMGSWWTNGVPRPWATSDDDVWIPGNPVLHFDGSQWQQLPSNGDYVVQQISGTGPHDVWALGDGPAGSAIYRWDGTHFVSTVDVPEKLHSLFAGRDGSLWVVGEGGASLRLDPP